MLFKGTKNRSAAQIAHEIDSVGGQLDAFTSREYTCFYTKTLVHIFGCCLKFFRICFIIRVFHLMIWHLKDRFIKEEIHMYEDSPEDLVYDLSSYAAWGDTPMGRTILGTYESLDGITPE